MDNDGVLARLRLKNVPHKLHGGSLIADKPGVTNVISELMVKSTENLSSVWRGLEVRSQLLPLT